MNQEIHAEFVGKINPHQWEHNSEEVQKCSKCGAVFWEWLFETEKLSCEEYIIRNIVI